MSHFETFALVTEGNISTAPSIFIASTVDTLAEMLVAGYMNDQHARIKLNDIIEVNYLDTSTYPLSTGEAALRATFRVTYDPSSQNWNLEQSESTVTGIGAYGLRSTRYTNAGGSATTVVTDSQINPNMVVLAAWQVSANAVSIEKVTPGIGTLTVLSSGDPGVSTLTYIAYTPSAVLQNIGVYVARYSNAGGSATITITDANLTTAMVVDAAIISSANAVIIEKVTVSAGSLVILCSANPGVSVIGYVGATPSTALTNLGLYAATYSNAGGSTTTTISDATITDSSDVVANWASSVTPSNIQKVTATTGSLTILSSVDPGVSVLNYQATPVNESAEESFFPDIIESTTSSSTPGTVRAFTGKTSGLATTMTSGNLVGVRGETDVVGASGGFLYGAQGKVIPTGTLSGSVWVAGVFAQFDLSHPAIINAAQLATLWGDWGATGGTATDLTGCRMLALTNTTSNVLNSQQYMYGNSTYMWELAGAGGTLNYYKAAGTSAGSAGDAAHCAAQQVIEIVINGTPAYIPVFTQNS